jgi:serine/threonine protein phosphatase 1
VLYAIGDIHGELGKLERLLDGLPLAAGDRLVFLGDYVDRGPDAAGVESRHLEQPREHHSEYLLGKQQSIVLE